MKFLLMAVFAVFFAEVQCKPASDVEGYSQHNSDVDSVIQAITSCADENVSLCLKEKVLHYAEGMASKREISITDGISFVGSGSPRSARALEPLPTEPEARESSIENRLYDVAVDFLENHVLQFRLPTSTINDVKRSIEEGRKKKLKKLLPFLALAKLKVTALIPLFLGILAAVAVKALLLGKVAFLVSALVLLKKLLSSKNEHEGYEVVHPHVEEHGYSGTSHGWAKSSPDSQNLAYSGYTKI